MDERERYLFDLRGYLVVPGVLDPEEVTAVNDAVDARGIPELLEETPYIHSGFPLTEPERMNTDPARGPVDTYLGALMDWGQPLRDLALHPRLVPYLEAIFGPHYRLDHSYGIFMRKGAGARGPHHLHNGGTPHDPSQYYLVRDGRIFTGLVVVSLALSDCGPGDGGFCCIPGSHTSAFPLPDEVAAIVDDTDPVVQVPVQAGDAVIFTEATTHGCIPWTAPHDRRAILLKYCPAFMQWERDSPMTDPARGWRPDERRLLSGPYAGQRPPVDAGR
ncbi:MAG TPA: phytanoyl-CoA dioxygenase family protein [Acidimicrobiales bacterium]